MSAQCHSPFSKGKAFFSRPSLADADNSCEPLPAAALAAQRRRLRAEAVSSRPAPAASGQAGRANDISGECSLALLRAAARARRWLALDPRVHPARTHSAPAAGPRLIHRGA